MSHFALVAEQSRKAKATRHVYEYLRGKLKDKSKFIPEVVLEEVQGTEGIRIEPVDRFRVLNIRLQDEYLSPFFKTDLNLFQLLMIDDHSDMSIFRGDKGWLFVFEGLAQGPQPFGQNGYDTR